MRKILVTLLLLCSMQGFASSSAYTLRQNDERVARVLELDQKQEDFMKLFHKQLNEKLSAFEDKDGSKLIKLLDNELLLPKRWLDKKQYVLYRDIILATFQNRGLINGSEKKNLN